MNFKQICGICFTHGVELKNIHISDPDRVTLLKKINNHPRNGLDFVFSVCKACDRYVDEYYDFRNKCLENNRTLMDHLKTLPLRGKCVCDINVEIEDLVKSNQFKVTNKNDCIDFEEYEIKTEIIKDESCGLGGISEMIETNESEMDMDASDAGRTDEYPHGYAQNKIEKPRTPSKIPIGYEEATKNKKEHLSSVSSNLLKKLTDDINIIKQDVKDIKNYFNKEPPDDIKRMDEIILPIDSDESLYEVEENLLDEGFKMKFVKELSLAGGNTLRKNVNLTMQKLLDKEMSLKYSTKGRKGKRSFSDLGVYHAVIRAIRLRFPNAVETEIVKYIGFTLAGAGDRNGGRLYGRKRRNDNDDVLLTQLYTQFNSSDNG